MQIEIKIDCDHATFDPDPRLELSLILSRLADKIQFASLGCTIRDTKPGMSPPIVPIFETAGNQTGEIKITP